MCAIYSFEIPVPHVPTLTLDRLEQSHSQSQLPVEKEVSRRQIFTGKM